MENLRKILKEANINHSEIAQELGIKSLSTVSLKVNGKAIFTTREAALLKNLINYKTNKNYSIEELFPVIE